MPPPQQCTRASATQAVVRTMEWLAPPNYGGNVTEICFSASDIGGGCHAAGRVDVTVKCVTFKVLKCKYSVGGEHQIAEVARLFGTDWLQIWKQNPGIVHPDYILFSGQALDVGRLYTVAASDSLYAISKRFGTPLETLYQLNYDLHGQPMVAEGFDLCLIPNSCRGEEASVYEGVSELRVYQCHEGNDGSGVGSNDGTVWPLSPSPPTHCEFAGCRLGPHGAICHGVRYRVRRGWPGLAYRLHECQLMYVRCRFFRLWKRVALPAR